MLRNRFYFGVARQLPKPSLMMVSYNQCGANPPNGQKLSYRRTATLNNQKTHSQNRSANRRLAPALC
jgi:hypothetical protein